jgi:hypothetical protein
VAFHIDGRRARILVQLDLVARVQDDLFGADDRAADDLAPADVRAFHQVVAESRSRRPPGLGRHDFTRYDQIAGLQRRIEAAGDAKRDDAPDACVVERAELRAQLIRIARAADDCQAGARSNAGLAVKPRYDKEWPPPGDSSACPHTHIPTPTVLELVFRKFL